MPGASGRGLSDLHSRSRRAGHLRARVSRRTHYGRATQALPDGSAGAGPFELSASVADAGLLAVSDRQHGARADYRDLSGAADEVSKIAASRRWPGARSGASVATAKWTSRNHSARSTSRSEEHTSELQSLMRISHAVFCLK